MKIAIQIVGFALAAVILYFGLAVVERYRDVTQAHLALDAEVAKVVRGLLAEVAEAAKNAEAEPKEEDSSVK
jgi:hypothetical protein